jgi:hypothetical protein
MPDLKPRQQLGFTWRFGGGTNTRASEDEIKDSEDAGGGNFALDLHNSQWRPRKGFALQGTATNGSAVNGFAQLMKTDGTLSTLIQAGTTVYEWDLSTGFTSVGTVSAGAKLRGPLTSNWNLSDIVIISDLGLVENVKTWDGTTFADLDTTGGSSSLTNFKAKYIFVENERVWAAGINENSTDLRHMIAASSQSDETSWTVTDRPSSALGDADPFQLTSPDLKPVNGLVYALGNVVFSTRYGSMYRILGSSAKDFSVLPLYSNSGASGDEAVIFVGDDVYYGRPGVIESLASVETLGNVTVDDLTRNIYTDSTGFDVKDVVEWRLVVDAGRAIVYCFPKDSDQVYVYYKAFRDEIAKGLVRMQAVQTASPWSVWTTRHPATFEPSCAWSMLDAKKIPQVYFGDTSGNIYQFESGHADGISTSIASERLSKSIETPRAALWDVEGHIIYRASTEERVLNLRFEHGGISITNQDISITLPALPLGPVWGGFQWNDGTYYGTRFVGRLSRRAYTAAGRSSRIQVRATIEGQSDFSIAEIGIRFKTGAQP